MKKYDFTGKTIQHDGRTLHQIVRLSDNLIGGYIESEHNLSHHNECFVYDTAKVLDNAEVSGAAAVFGNAKVSGNARVFDDAAVYHNAEVSGNAEVFGNAKVFDKVRVSGNAVVFGNAKVSGNTRVFGNAEVFGTAWVSGNAVVFGNAKVFGNARVFNDARVSQTPLTISGSLTHSITITETHIFIGCAGHTIEHWKRNIVAIGRSNGYKDAEIKQVIGYIKTTLQARKK